MEALINASVLTEDGVQKRHTVVIDGPHIAAVKPDADFERGSMPERDLAGRLLLPGFIDVQVNGGGGLLFNDAPTVETIRRIGRAHRQYGTTGFLPTLISDDLDKLAAAIDATREAMAEGVQGVLGVHLEGPFLNPVKKGAHDETKLRTLDDAALDLLTSLDNGITLVTLAPEMAPPGAIRQLVDAGVIVAAGHSNATYAQAMAAITEGLRGFTHLFNAMSPLGSREPGVVGAALDNADSWCGVINDGHHVHAASLRIAMAAKRRQRFLLVTDAMPSVGAECKTFELDGRTIRVEDGRCMAADGTLAGSDLDMASAVRNSLSWLGLDLADAVAMASRHPAEFLGLGGCLGRIAPGYAANLVLADDALQVIDTWIDGEPAR